MQFGSKLRNRRVASCRIATPIAVARRVLEASPHSLLVGPGAQRFARDHGFTVEPNEQLLPPGWGGEGPAVRREGSGDLRGATPSHDTLSVIALDKNRNIAAGSLVRLCETIWSSGSHECSGCWCQQRPFPNNRVFGMSLAQKVELRSNFRRVDQRCERQTPGSSRRQPAAWFRTLRWSVSLVSTVAIPSDFSKFLDHKSSTALETTKMAASFAMFSRNINNYRNANMSKKMKSHTHTHTHTHTHACLHTHTHFTCVSDASTRILCRQRCWRGVLHGRRRRAPALLPGGARRRDAASGHGAAARRRRDGAAGGADAGRGARGTRDGHHRPGHSGE